MGNEISEDILIVDRDERLTCEMTYEQAKATLIQVIDTIIDTFKDTPEGQKFQERKDHCMQELQKLEYEQDDQKKFVYVLQVLDTILSQAGNPSPFDVECCLGKNENGQFVFLSKNISNTAKKYSKTIIVTQEELVRISDLHQNTDKAVERDPETNEPIFQTIVVPNDAEITPCKVSKSNVPTPYEWINPRVPKTRDRIYRWN